MLTGWRLAAPEFAATAEGMMSGEGARLFGGRWNSPGVRAVYLGDSLALAGMELLVHLGNLDVLRTYRKLPVTIPDELVMHIDPVALPVGWETSPHAVTRAIGDQMARRRAIRCSAGPSAVITVECNFVVNPHHPDVGTISIGPVSDFRFDPRLMNCSVVAAMQRGRPARPL